MPLDSSSLWSENGDILGSAVWHLSHCHCDYAVKYLPGYICCHQLNIFEEQLDKNIILGSAENIFLVPKGLPAALQQVHGEMGGVIRGQKVQACWLGDFIDWCIVDALVQWICSRLFGALWCVTDMQAKWLVVYTCVVNGLWTCSALWMYEQALDVLESGLAGASAAADRGVYVLLLFMVGEGAATTEFILHILCMKYSIECILHRSMWSIESMFCCCSLVGEGAATCSGQVHVVRALLRRASVCLKGRSSVLPVTSSKFSSAVLW